MAANKRAGRVEIYACSGICCCYWAAWKEHPVTMLIRRTQHWFRYEDCASCCHRALCLSVSEFARMAANKRAGRVEIYACSGICCCYWAAWKEHPVTMLIRRTQHWFRYEDCASCCHRALCLSVSEFARMAANRRTGRVGIRACSRSCTAIWMCVKQAEIIEGLVYFTQY